MREGLAGQTIDPAGSARWAWPGRAWPYPHRRSRASASQPTSPRLIRGGETGRKRGGEGRRRLASRQAAVRGGGGFCRRVGAALRGEVLSPPPPSSLPPSKLRAIAGLCEPCLRPQDLPNRGSGRGRGRWFEFGPRFKRASSRQRCCRCASTRGCWGPGEGYRGTLRKRRRVRAACSRRWTLL